jgi:AraC-like DNA-binding protein
VVTTVLVDPQSEAVVLPGELVALVARQAVNEGPTRAAWPGLTFYRFEQRVWLLESAARENNGNVITAAIAFMKQEMHHPLSVQDLAEAVSMSESGFAHMFKAATGVSPLQFLKQLRMEQARRFLLGGSNVSEAADSVGYSSLSHFISEFKRYFGKSPRAYTQRLRDVHAAAISDASSMK